MKNTIFFLVFLLSCSTQAQTNIPFSSSEKTVLDLLSRDSTSCTTIYLPHSMKMGVEWPKQSYMAIVKEKKNIFFLLAGTQRVYKMNPENYLLPLIRIDSSDFFGDNSNCMAFLHQDTLYQYGGYGFWKNRDFFTRFVPISGDWEFVQGGDGLENLLTLSYLDRQKDMFYSFGHYEQNTFSDFIPAFKDSIYQYNMSTKHWKNLGVILPHHLHIKTSLINGSVFETPWGLVVRTIPQNFLLIDFKNNQVVPFKKTIMDSLEGILRIQEREIINSNSNHNFIYLLDTLHFLREYQNEFSVKELKLDSTMLDYTLASSLFKPISKIDATVFMLSFSPKNLLTGSAFAFLFFTLILLLFNYQKRNHAQVASAALLKQEKINVADAIPTFIHSLPEVEKELLKELIQFSLKQKKMPASIVNKMLGVTHKESDIQKARRSQAITHINESFSGKVKVPGLLISRKRDSFDKRAFEYFIPDDLVPFISPFIT